MTLFKRKIIISTIVDIFSFIIGACIGAFVIFIIHG